MMASKFGHRSRGTTTNMSYLMLFLLYSSTCFQAYGEEDDDNFKGNIIMSADELAESMSMEENIGQMNQRNTGDFYSLASKKEDELFNASVLYEYLHQGTGAFVSSPLTLWKNERYGQSMSSWRTFVYSVQNAAEEAGSKPILYGIHAIHGANYIHESTMFPQQINAAATFNTKLVYEMGRVIGQESIEAAIPWYFGPVMDVAMYYHWPFMQETFGADPLVVSKMVSAILKGLQSTEGVVACGKRYAGFYALKNRAHSECAMYNTVGAPFFAAIGAGLQCAMETFNGKKRDRAVRPMEKMNKLIRFFREEVHFDGMLMSDYDPSVQIKPDHNVNMEWAQARTNITIDMSTISSFIDYRKEMQPYLSEETNHEDFSRAARRILKIKAAAQLLNDAMPGFDLYVRLPEEKLMAQVENNQTALDVATESIVLLQNKNNILPLQEKEGGILLLGDAADSIAAQCGGWSFSPGVPTVKSGTTIRGALNSRFGDRLTYLSGVSLTGVQNDMDTVIKAAKSASRTIIVIGEPASVSQEAVSSQLDFVRQVALQSSNVILILLFGTPWTLGDLPDYVDGVVHAMHPCSHGGHAIANILLGDNNPSGRLPFAYPAELVFSPDLHMERKRISYRRSTSSSDFQWPFAFGLSYTTFAYADLHLSSTVLTDADDLHVTVTVENTGNRAGSEVATLFVFARREGCTDACSCPIIKYLKGFQKHHYLSGQQRQVKFILKKEDWQSYSTQEGSPSIVKATIPGDYIIGLDPTINCLDEEAHHLCLPFELLGAIAKK